MLDLESNFIRIPEIKQEQPKEEKRSRSFLTVYRKKRYLNRECYFQDEDNIEISIPPSRMPSKLCYLPDNAEKGIQCKPYSAEDTANTEALQFASEGVLHAEGGWPKDVSYLNSEQTARYKRKIEKTEEYIQQLSKLTQTMMHMIKQNNAVNIYQSYFEEIEPLDLTEQYSSRTITVFHEHEDINRPVTNLGWNLEMGNQFVCSFSNEHQYNNIIASYIWDVDCNSAPYLKLYSSHPAPCIEYNPKDYHILASGINSGQVVVWDSRAGGHEQLISNHEYSHRDSVNCLVWFTSKTNSEFFTGSIEGQLCWWDIRKLEKPTDRMFLDPIQTDSIQLDRAASISALDSDPSIATKYMAGTEQGILYTCNRKGKSSNEKITSRVKCHFGAICSVTRSPHFIKNYMTVGDWQAKIWTEDNKDTSIVWTKEYIAQLTCGVWSETRCAVFFIGRIDGMVDIWDIVQDLSKPVYSLKISDYPVLSLKHHKEGKFLIVGTSDGHVYLQELSDNLVHTYSNERPLMASMLERETKRERFLEIRIREVKLREKELRREKELARMQWEEDKATEKDNIEAAEENFMSVIDAEIKRREGDARRMMDRDSTMHSHNRTGASRIIF